MARQRDLERAGWQFVRIRGGEFYRDRDKATVPLWSELDRLGIKLGGVDEAAAEPPPPVDVHNIERTDVDVVDPVSVSPAEIGADYDSTDTGSEPAVVKQGEFDGVVQSVTLGARQSTGGLLADYTSYNGPNGLDPRTVSIGEVADGLCLIIEAEGPMIAKRAYDIYLRGCGIKRLGGELKSTMNKSLASLVRQGRVVSENEPGNSGLIYSTVRSKGSPPVKLRSRGPRTFEEIPPGELRAVGKHVCETRNLIRGSGEHLRAVLEYFDLKRLTTQVVNTLLEILANTEQAGLDKVVDVPGESFSAERLREEQFRDLFEIIFPIANESGTWMVCLNEMKFGDPVLGDSPLTLTLRLVRFGTDEEGKKYVEDILEQDVVIGSISLPPGPCVVNQDYRVAMLSLEPIIRQRMNSVDVGTLMPSEVLDGVPLPNCQWNVAPV
jgi:hypothetical protein